MAGGTITSGIVLKSHSIRKVGTTIMELTSHLQYLINTQVSVIAPHYSLETGIFVFQQGVEKLCSANKGYQWQSEFQN